MKIHTLYASTHFLTSTFILHYQRWMTQHAADRMPTLSLQRLFSFHTDDLSDLVISNNNKRTLDLPAETFSQMVPRRSNKEPIFLTV